MGSCESEQGTVGEGRLHPDRGEHARAAARRSSTELGITPGLKVLDLGCGDGTTALPAARRGAEVLGVDIAANLVAAGNERARAEGLTNCTFQEGDASDLAELSDDSFDLVVTIFGAMFAPQAVRRRQGDGARDSTRRPDRDGQLDPRRPDAGRAAFEDQRRLLATAAGGLHQPGDVGSRGQRSRAVRRRRDPAEQISFSRETYRSSTRQPRPSCVAAFRNYYGPTMNAFEAAAAAGRADALQARARGTVQQPEHQRQRQHLDPSDLPARRGHRLTRSGRSGAA